MKRVLVIAPLSPPITGQQQASVELVRTLSARYTVETADYSKTSFRQGNFTLERFAAIVRLIARSSRLSRNAAITYLTVSQSLLGNLRDLLIIAFCKSPAVILHLHGGGIGGLLFRRNPLLRLLNRAVCRRVDRIVVLSSSLRGNYRGVVPMRKLTAIPGFVDCPSGDPESALSKHEAERISVLYLSNMIREKGFRDLLDGYRRLDARTRARIEVDFVGAFDDPREESDFRRALSALAGARYHGSVSGRAKEELLARAQVLCLPSFYPYEGQPVVILEAYSHGCIVLTSDQGGIPDVFRDGVNGLRVQARSPSDISRRLREVLGMSPDDRKRIARANIQYARESFTRAAFEQRMLGLFQGVLAERRPVASAPRSSVDSSSGAC